jgi:hypothetical protein
MKKIGLLALALVLALGALGVGYAMWTDTVLITGTVGTGNLILGVADTSTDDPAGSPDPQCGPGHNEEQKDVASFVSINGTPKAGCTDFYESITETFTHVYPYYGPTVTVEVKNCGTVPLKITGMALTNFTGTDLTPWMSFVWTIYDEYGVAHPGSGNWDAFVAALGTPQIGGGMSIIIEKTICFQELDGQDRLLPQNASMSYTFTVTGAQWNEVP